MNKNQRIFKRNLALEKLGYLSYREYLRSGHWADVKRAYYASEEPQGCICGEAEHLQLHHMTYERVGHEELTDLTPLCRTCHTMIHVLVNRGELGLDFSGFVDKARAEGYGENARKALLAAQIDEGIDEDYGPLLRAMEKLRLTMEAQPREERRRSGRALWILKTRLHSAERELKLRIEQARDKGVVL